MRQLLNHTSGLPQDFEGAPPASQDEVIDGRFDSLSFDQIIRQTLYPEGRPGPGPRFSPGTRQEYNSFGYRIAGELIESLTGHSLPRRGDQAHPQTPRDARHRHVVAGQGHARAPAPTSRATCHAATACSSTSTNRAACPPA
ncbi:serine hydrolase [Streptomyces cirratus]